MSQHEGRGEGGADAIASLEHEGSERVAPIETETVRVRPRFARVSSIIPVKEPPLVEMRRWSRVQNSSSASGWSPRG